MQLRGGESPLRELPDLRNENPETHTGRRLQSSSNDCLRGENEMVICPKCGEGLYYMVGFDSEYFYCPDPLCGFTYDFSLEKMAKQHKETIELEERGIHVKRSIKDLEKY